MNLTTRMGLILGAATAASFIALGAVVQATPIETQAAAPNTVVTMSEEKRQMIAAAIADANEAAARMEADAAAAEAAAAEMEAIDTEALTISMQAPEEPAPAPAPEVETFPATTLYTTTVLNVREGASVDTAQVDQLPAGAEVVVDAHANGFDRLVDGPGWVATEFLTSDAPAPTPAPAPVPAPAPPAPAPAFDPVEFLQGYASGFTVEWIPGLCASMGGSVCGTTQRSVIELDPNADYSSELGRDVLVHEAAHLHQFRDYGAVMDRLEAHGGFEVMAECASLAKTGRLIGAYTSSCTPAQLALGHETWSW